MEKNKALTKDDLINALAGFNKDFLVPGFKAMDEKINRANSNLNPPQKHEPRL